MIKNRETDFVIAKENLTTTYMKKDGNLDYHTKEVAFFLNDENGCQISQDYFYMIYLGNDHFAVCDISVEKDYLEEFSEFDIIKGEIELTNPSFKWGIIRINRDSKGSIIPLGETQIFPCIYDRLSFNNLKTVTAYNNHNLTYLDIDVDSPGYGQQLVPCVLGHAVPFDTIYEGLAECSVGDVLGFLPRNTLVRTSLCGNDLLTPEEAYNISEFLKENPNISIDNNTENKYFNLTGTKLLVEKNNLVRRKNNNK